MSTVIHWTTKDLETLPDDGTRYEIVEGELLMTRAPNFEHQHVCGKLYSQLLTWSERTKAGEPYLTPGLIFADDDNVIPDLIWMSKARLVDALDDAGHFIVAPELVIEVLSYGADDERRDRVIKLALYSKYGVQDYWIVDWRNRKIEIYRRANEGLNFHSVLNQTDTLTSPLLPEFQCRVGAIFEHI
ncbi:MAG: Uma2 family endonuclease [Acidobacteriota bacterium]